MGFEVEPVSIEGVWRVNAGIRPFRVEGPVYGRRTIGSKTIIDNFGHGAHGWTIGYGSTKRALQHLGEEGN
jgi:glycine/D-amino acid oxidase-like deaminating enzyme